MFPSPISIEENKVVKMDATIMGPNSYYIEEGQGVESAEVDGVKVTFSSWPNNSHNIFIGQFYEIILSSDWCS